MRDYSDAPSWATEAFNLKSDQSRDWYYGNETHYATRNMLRLGKSPHAHSEVTLAIIRKSDWWREPLNVIVENE